MKEVHTMKRTVIEHMYCNIHDLKCQHSFIIDCSIFLFEYRLISTRIIHI